MAAPNFKCGDLVRLNVPYQMTGFGEVPANINLLPDMIVIKKCRSGLYQCVVPFRRNTISVPKNWLTKSIRCFTKMS